jgi:uncharacterized membrane protein
MQFKQFLNRLKKPSVLISLASLAVKLLIVLGLDINESAAIQATVFLCSIMVTLGIMSDPEAKAKGFGDDLLVCSSTGEKERHVEINGQMMCTKCGAVNKPDNM